MNASRRFLWGGIGAMMPVLVTVVSLDLPDLFNEAGAFTAPNVVGIGIRYFVLFILGGIVAYFHTTEVMPLKLFEIGIAAPALITSIMTAGAAQPTKVPAQQTTAPAVNSSSGLFSIGGVAHAADNRRESDEPAVMVVQVFDGILKGFTGGVYSRPQGPDAQFGGTWVLASGGQVPPGAVKGGQESAPGAEDLYLCSARFNDGFHPGKVRAAFGGCNIGWGGIEYTVRDYKVLIGTYNWVAARDGQIPPGAIKAGQEHPPGREDLYACRARFNNGLQPGKVRPALGGCFIPWGGIENVVREYEVLVK